MTDAVASFDWDLPKAQQLHRALSEELKKETVEVDLLDHAREQAESDSGASLV